MSQVFEIRKAEASDAPAILSLLRQAFPLLKFAEAWWQWFFDGPTRSYLLTDDGSVAGMVSLIEYPSVKIAGESVRGTLAANLCLLPAYQRKNRGGDRSYFVDLLEETVRIESGLGVEISLVVPNANSAGRLKSLGWQEIASLVTWQKEAPTPTHGSSYAEAAVDEPLVDALNKKPGAEKGSRIQRSASFLSWRLEKRPAATYEFALGEGGGATILKHFSDDLTGTSRLHLMDFGCPGESDFEGVLGYAESRASAAEAINFWLAEGDPLSDRAEKRGFLPVSKRPLLVRPLCAGLGGKDSPQFAFTFSDCDVY